MGKLSRSQRTIIIVSAVGVVFLIVGIIIFYFPSKKRIKDLKTELDDMNQQIDRIFAIVGKEKSIGEGIQSLEELYKTISARFPQKEERGIRLLSDYARRLNMEVGSLVPASKVPFLDQEAHPVVIDGETCQAELVSMEMRGSYQDLVEYIRELQEDFPTLVTIESLSISKDSAGPDKLNIRLGLRFYLLS
jgi:Tfp pilus assembly protein PilO